MSTFLVVISVIRPNDCNFLNPYYFENRATKSLNFEFLWQVALALIPKKTYIMYVIWQTKITFLGNIRVS